MLADGDSDGIVQLDPAGHGFARSPRLATRDNALHWHGRFTLSQRAASELIADVRRAARQWRAYFEEFGVDAAETDEAAPAFRHIDAISAPAMRTLLL